MILYLLELNLVVKDLILVFLSILVLMFFKFMFNLLIILFVNLYDLGWMFVLLKKLFELWIFKNLIVCL